MITVFRAHIIAFLALLLTPLPPAHAASVIIDAPTAGIAGDGVTLNTTAIQKAIDDCTAGGGGVLHFPKGRYLTGTIQIKSNVTLRVDDGATLLGSTSAADYRNLDPFIDGSGNPLGHALIVAVDSDHVGIEGAGTIDGQGPAIKAHQASYKIRPFLVRWVHCTNVTVKDVHLINPGAWTLNFFGSKGVTIEGITIRSRGLGLANNDGINIDSSEDIQVSNCDVESGDDALVIKSTSAAKAPQAGNITASDCKLSTRTNAIKLGTESIGGFEKITVSKCAITKTQMAGIALYEVDGGELHDVTIRDVTMDDVALPISIRLGARNKTFREGDKAKETGTLRDVMIENVSAKNVGMVGMLINGVPGHAVENVKLENISLELPGGKGADAAKIQLPEKEAAYPEFDMFGKTIPAYGIYARHVKEMTFENVHMNVVKADERPGTVLIDVAGVTPCGFTGNEAKRVWMASQSMKWQRFKEPAGATLMRTVSIAATAAWGEVLAWPGWVLWRIGRVWGAGHALVVACWAGIFWSCGF